MSFDYQPPGLSSHPIKPHKILPEPLQPTQPSFEWTTSNIKSSLCEIEKLLSQLKRNQQELQNLISTRSPYPSIQVLQENTQRLKDQLEKKITIF